MRLFNDLYYINPLYTARAMLNKKRMQQKRNLSDKDILVGGKLSLAPELIRSRIEDMLLNILSKLLNTHWNIVKDYIE